MLLSAAIAWIACRRWQSGLLVATALLSAGLWAILDGIWLPSYAFSVVEPSLLVVVLATLALSAIAEQWQLMGGAFAIFGASGVVATALALQRSPNDTTAIVNEAIRSGSPMLVGGAIAAAVVFVGQQRGWKWLTTFCTALAIGLVLDSSLYTVLVHEQALWHSSDWVQPLLAKVSDKLLLAAIAVATFWSLGVSSALMREPE